VVNVLWASTLISPVTASPINFSQCGFIVAYIKYMLNADSSDTSQTYQIRGIPLESVSQTQYPGDVRYSDAKLLGTSRECLDTGPEKAQTLPSAFLCSALGHTNE
jgi:hypothetical protein